MRILIINTSERTGGAAVAASRLLSALTHVGLTAEMLVRDRQTDDPRVHTFGQKWRMKWAFLWERWCVFMHLRFRRRNLFALDIANAGASITKTDAFRRADVIHLHWVNQGVLSLAELQNILASGKPVVWTLHDIWPVTGICHLALDCRRYTHDCGRCPYLSRHREDDLSRKIWAKKHRTYRSGSMTFVACSRWLAGEARAASLTRGHRVTDIPNAIDTDVFAPRDRTDARCRLGLPADRGLRIVLFVAQRITNLNKGIPYLAEAFRNYLAAHPEHGRDTAVLILGGAAESFSSAFEVPVFTTPYTYDVEKIVDLYNASDIFVLPSVSENLPNTIMEALSCGIPCLGFRVGGIPELIDHGRNGYVAAPRDADDLCAGLHALLDVEDREAYGKAARQKVLENYALERVGARYADLYRQVLTPQNDKS